MRPPRHLADRKVDYGAIAEMPWSAESRAHRRDLNLEACAAIRRTMDEQTGQPIVKLIVPEFGPPSAVIESDVFDTNIESDVSRWDREARGSSGKYLRTRHR
jgi:hypothetical protein